MRKQRFYWAFMVAAIVLTAYGGYSLIYNAANGKNLLVLGLVFFILGTLMLLAILAVFLVNLYQKKNKPVFVEPEAKPIEQPKKGEKAEAEECPELKEEPKSEEPPKPAEEPKPEPVVTEPTAPSATYEDDDEIEYVRPQPIRRSRGGSAYISRVGYGTVLRVEGDQIVDMRSNTYYRIDDDVVMRNGSGPVFEVSGNRIRQAYGSYLYEISGGSVNKVFGGYYASFEGNTLKTYDLREIYEVSGSLSLTQKLAVVALLFGSY